MPRRKNKNRQPPPPRSVDSCQFCQRSHLKLSKCSKCKEVFYCSADCQKKDWIHHKKVCKPEETKQQSPDPSLLPDEEESCSSCGKTGVKLSVCSQCKGAKYCSKECQKAEWSKHKVYCKKNSLPKSGTPPKSQRRCRGCSNFCADGSEFCDTCPLTKGFENMFSQGQKCYDCDNVSESDSVYCVKCITRIFYSSFPLFTGYPDRLCLDCPNMSLINSVYCNACVASKYSKTVAINKVEIKNCRECSSPCAHLGYCIQCLTKRTSGKMFPLGVPDKVYQIAKTRYPEFKLITDFNDIDTVLSGNHFVKRKQVLLVMMIGPGGHAFRPSMILRDEKEAKYRIIFHLDDNDRTDQKKWALFEIGNFICIMYPKIHHFLDGSVGFRLNSTNLVSFIKCFP